MVMVGIVVVGAGEAAHSCSGDGDASRSSDGAEGEHCAGMLCLQYLMISLYEERMDKIR